MSFGPIHELERDLGLLEDVTSDLGDAWTSVLRQAVTPGEVDRISRIRQRLQVVNEHLSQAECRMGSLVVHAARERV